MQLLPMVLRVFPKRYRCAEYDWTCVGHRIDNCAFRVHLAESELQSNQFGYPRERHRSGWCDERCRSTPSTFAAVSVWGAQCRLGNSSQWSCVQNPNCKLTTLDIAENKIGSDGAESIAKALKVQST